MVFRENAMGKIIKPITRNPCLFLLGLLLIVSSSSCSNMPDEKLSVEPVEYYVGKLVDETFVWKGPTANEYRVPKNQAARALAYLGDPAVDHILDAIAKDLIDINSAYDALREIGLPMDKFQDDLYKDRDVSRVRTWWANNQESTKTKRSDYREQIGLPKITP